MEAGIIRKWAGITVVFISYKSREKLEEKRNSAMLIVERRLDCRI